MSDIPFLAAQTVLQDSHLRPNPAQSSEAFENAIAPPTAADSASKILFENSDASEHEPTFTSTSSSQVLVEKSTEDGVEEDVASISSSVLDSDYLLPSNTTSYYQHQSRHPHSRHHHSDSHGFRHRYAVYRQHHPLPPLPDLRFEQSYLAGIRHAVDEEKWWLVALLTVKDQVVFPLVQGTLWNLGLLGWRYWNRGVKFKGFGLGARIRRWWWEVNGWEYPVDKKLK